ncbi:MAG: hypothetical protein ACOY3X_09520 [Pseudomonadota bacterium]
METLYVSLALMATSGITFIAYRHPVLYEKEFSPKLFVSSGLILLAIIFHDIGVNTAFKDLTPYFKDGVGEQVKKVSEESAFPGVVWVVVLAIFFYGLFLSWLADHMKREHGFEEEETEGEEEE